MVTPHGKRLEARAHVLVLAGRLAGDERDRARRLVHRLESRHLQVDFVGLSGTPRHSAAGTEANGSTDARFPGAAFDWPALGWRGVRSLAARWFPMADLGDRPGAILALTVDLAESAIEMARYWRIPYIQIVEEFPLPGRSLRICRDWCRVIVAASPELADELVEAHRIPAERIRVVHPGWPVHETKSHVLEPGRIPVVGTAGSWVPGAGQASFLKAARLVRDAQIDVEFILAGRGPSETQLRRLTDNLGLSDRVTFAETKQSTEPFWGVLDVYVQPSLIPTVGRPLINAMAHGVPAVASDVEGLRTLVIDGQTGLCRPPGDSEPMAHAMLELLADPVGARIMSDRGRSRISELFDPEREADRLADLLSTLADDGSG